MIFTSLNFLLFFPSVAVLFYLSPIKWRPMLLLLASVLFYLNMNPVYLMLLLGVGISTYYFTNAITRTKSEKKKYTLLATHVTLILLPLFFFKYFGAINNQILSALAEHGMYWPLPKLQFLLPVGISFYTFLAIGYAIDVYNEEVEAEKDFGIVMLFISFFPLILSGPIERAAHMLPQYKNLKPINYNDITNGFKLMLWGYFMKLVVADRLGMYIDSVYHNIDNHNGSTLLLTTFLYPFQVYTDLGGYSLIAIGTAKALGLDVMHNFKRPFFATSMADLWRRWHISLITWLTDYVYTPLAFHFRKYHMTGILISLMLTFLISGIWHGASLTFIVWGLMQGFYLSVEALLQKSRNAWEQKHRLNSNRLYLLVCMVSTFLLFSASQIFGRAPDLPTAFTVYRKIFTAPGNLYLDITTLFFSLAGLALVMLKDIDDEFFNKKYSLFSSRYGIIRYGAYLSVLFIIILFGVFSGSSFIYFQF